jgi:dihydrolipoamide dehydrogenase
VEVLQGHGAVKGPGKVSIDGHSVESKNIIIATGSYPITPDIKGFKEALLTTDEVLDMPAAPSSVLVWGDAGPIDVEMAALLHILGTKVFLATPQRRILPMEDHDSSQRMEQAFREQGIQVLTRSTLQSVEKAQKNFNACLVGREDQTIEVEKILFTGRKPYTVDLGLEQAGVQFSEEGNVLVNESLQTSVTGIYAVGDITGGWMNSHAASAMAVTAAENAMGQTNEFSFHLVPRGIWTFPQVGAVGLTEEQAEKKGIDVEVGDFPYSMNGLAMCHGELAGSVKIVSDASCGEILGIHIVGANATELVGEAVLAVQLECTADELAHSIRVHPTLSEALVDAGRDAAGWK